MQNFHHFVEMLFITGISNEKKTPKNKCINHIWNITSKRHNILPTISSFFISSIEKIESVQEFKLNFSSSCYKNYMATCIKFQQT